MSGSSDSSSFIPKQGTKKNVRKIRNFNVYVLSILSYVFFFVSLTISGVVYFYEKTVTAQLNNEIQIMNDAVASFKESDLRRVEEFDVRLQQANDRLNNSASVKAVLEAIESTLSQTIQITNLFVERKADVEFVVQAQAATDSYDSAIFQRDTLLQFDLVDAVEIRDVVLEESVGEENNQTISMLTLLTVPIVAVPYEVSVSEVDTIPAEEEDDLQFITEEVVDEQSDI